MNSDIQKVVTLFTQWIKIKIILHVRKDRVVSFHEREVWWVSIGMNVGSEQYGKNGAFERPVLILKKFGQQMFWGVPLTSQRKDARYYHSFVYRKYKKQGDKLFYIEKKGVLVMSQLRTLSSKRLIRKSGIISKVDFLGIRDMVRSLV